MPRPHPSLAPFAPTSAEPFDRARAAHLLARLTFAGTTEEVDRVLADGLHASVDRLLDFPTASADETTPDDLPDHSPLASHPRTYRERDELVGKLLTKEEKEEARQAYNRANNEALRNTFAWWLKRLANTPWPAQEKLTFLWHGHFTTSARDVDQARLIWRQNETWRAHAGGNLRAFVKAVGRDPAMLGYLDGRQSRKGAPNENYARELMELFTLGLGRVYKEADVKEMARAFTGWTHDGDRARLEPRRHDADPKTIFGKTANYDDDRCVDLLFEQRACGDYLAARVWSWLAGDAADPLAVDPALAGALGDVLREADFELRPLLRVILLSRGFHDRKTIGAQIKSPVQLLVGTCRVLGIDFDDVGRARNHLDRMGQVPFQPPNVAGWPGGRAWIDTNTLFARYNLVAQLVAKIDGDRLVPTAALTPSEAARYWAGVLVGRPLADARLKALADAMPTKADPLDRQRTLLAAIVSTPEYQLC